MLSQVKLINLESGLARRGELIRQVKDSGPRRRREIEQSLGQASRGDKDKQLIEKLLIGANI